MGPLVQLEKAIADALKGVPALPKGFKEWLVKYLPWLDLATVALTAWSVWIVWDWAHTANAWINYANEFSRAVGGTEIATTRLSIGIWLSLGVLLVEGVIYLLAFSGLRDKKKAGWNFLFYGSIINVLYGIVILFTSYGGFGNLVGSLIGTAIGWYFLFQIREYYNGKKIEEPKAAEPTATEKTE